jgi:ABC-type molybdate transport system permease subunit
LATAADKVVRGQGFYRTLLIWPYAVAPAVAGMLWLFMFNPAMGTLAYLLRRNGFAWDPLLNGNQAMALVVVAAAWKQISYNFLFFVAGLQAIPKSLIEAASIDGARGSRRFWTIVFPLLAPTTFFLLVVNTVYAFFDTFGIIHSVTGGGPAKATETLVYKVYNDGFVNLEPRLVGGAIGDPDDHRHRTDRLPVPLRREARALWLRAKYDRKTPGRQSVRPPDADPRHHHRRLPDLLYIHRLDDDLGRDHPSADVAAAGRSHG